MNADESHAAQSLRKIKTTEVEQFLRVGLSVSFDCDIAKTNSRRYPAKVLGWKSGRYLILEISPRDSQRSLTLGNSRGALRFIHLGQPCAMRVFCHETHLDSARALFTVTWPDEVVYVKLRANDRFEIHAPCSAALPNGRTAVGELRDISLGGARLFLPVRPEAGDIVAASFKLPDGAPCLNTELRIRHVVETAGGFECGCCTGQLSEITRNNIQFYLAVRIQHQHQQVDRSESILFVDEDPERLAEALGYFREQGYETIVARDVVQAFTWLGIADPRAVVVHAGLECVDAPSLCALIHSSAKCESTPIVLYGGGSVGADTLAFAGALAHLAGLDDRSDYEQILPLIGTPRAAETHSSGQ